MRDRDTNKQNVSLRAEQLERALKTLEQIIDEPMREDRSNVDASIHRFEFTFELFWKLLKGLLESEGIDKHSPKQILIAAYSAYMINDEKIWLAMLEDRNNTSHTYKEKLADEIYLRIKKYVKVLRSEFEDLKKKYEL
jgi:nucleotidyltransferase substrate binding protein (TIGR01987 family)